MGERLRRWEVPMISRIIDRSGIVEKIEFLKEKVGLLKEDAA
jgi:hypothetical protein